MLDRPAATNLLRTFHDKLAAEIWPDRLVLAGIAFRQRNKINEGHPLYAELMAIFVAHCERCLGKSSPTECDEKVRKVINA